MITKEILTTFVDQLRVKQKRTWDQTAEAAFKKLQIGRNGKPFTGAGFQSYVERHTGRLKWGASVDRQPKPTLPSEPVKPEPVPSSLTKQELFMGMPLTATPLVKDILASNLSADNKVKMMELLVK